MKTFLHSLSALLILLLLLAARVPSVSAIYEEDEKYFQKADSLLALLSLEEKAGQMTNIGLTALTQGPFWNNFDTLLLDSQKMKELLIISKVGSVQNKGIYPPCRMEWYRLIKNIQDFTLEHSGHKIPILFGIDGVHGANYTAGSTLFPHQIALAATWEPEYARITGEVTAYELRASSTPWNYGPVLDVSMQPLWGRINETFGEDTYMNRVMGEAFIRGAQGNSMGEPTRTAVCLKHFVGYGTPFNGKDRSPALIPEHYLRQYYLPPFQTAIENGALTIMANSGSVNGIPGHIDHYLLTTVLKEEMGFKGFVISDWNDIERLETLHRVAHSRREATKIAIMAGIDMSMVPYDASFAHDIIDLVNSGEIPMSRIDDAVRRILFVKFKLGLFETPYHHPDEYPLFGSDQFAHQSYLAAQEAITLLKNEDALLPLSAGNKKILVTGPGANRLTALNGPWSRTWAGNNPAYDDEGKKTILQALQDEFGVKNVWHTPGTDYEGAVEQRKKLMAQARKADVVVVCLGERPATEKFSDTDDLNLPANQLELVKELARSGKPIVLVMLQGRPRVIREIEPLADAIIHAYWPGHEGGRALASLLSGKANFSGKLPYTWPRFPARIQTYQHKGSDKLDNTFGMNGFFPQWEFGYGLSYTSFEYSQLQVATDTLHSGQDVHFKITLSNTGSIAGKEVVQVYLRDKIASISPDDKKLVGFQKIQLQPSECKTLSFTIPFNELKFVNTQNQWIAETGEFEILVGGKPDNLQSSVFYYLETEKTSK